MTDNPSGSTGQNVTVPPNAPEAGSNGEREAIIATIRATRSDWGSAYPGSIPPDNYVAGGILAAGFTRAHHDGEGAAAMKKEYWDVLALVIEDQGDCAFPLADIVKAKLDQLTRERDEARAMLNIYANAADRAFQGRDAVLPYFVRLGGCKAEGIVKLAEAYRPLRAERDALAADFASTLRQADEDRAYLRERAEAAEKRAAEQGEALDDIADVLGCDNGVTPGDIAAAVREWGDEDDKRVVEAEKRAAALASALREIEALNYATAATNGCAYTAHLIARAALAGNGNGTGEGAT